jgi:hypothetical protein
LRSVFVYDIVSAENSICYFIRKELVMKNLYRIPLIERFIDASKPPSSGNKLVCMNIRGIGVFIYYREDADLNIVGLSKTLVGIKDTECLIEADTPQEAIEKFYNEWEGAKTGGDSPESKALWISEKRKTLQYPPCELMHRNKRNELTCGKPVDAYDDAGEYGMCTLEGYDSPDDCPVSDFFQLVCNKGDDIEIRIVVEGFSIIRPCDVGYVEQKELAES